MCIQPHDVLSASFGGDPPFTDPHHRSPVGPMTFIRTDL